LGVVSSTDPATLSALYTKDLQLLHAPGEIHLWCVNPNQISSKDACAYTSLLTGDECAYLEGIQLQSMRNRYLVTRALTRDVLSRYLGSSPGAIQLTRNAHGKPRLAGFHEQQCTPSFSISHTAEMIVMGVGQMHALGVDVEQFSRPAHARVARLHFCPEEHAAIRHLPPEERPHRFWALWTLKESYFKALGIGLSGALQQYAFDLDAPGSIVPRFDPGSLQPDAAESNAGALSFKWQFWQLHLPANHLVSICAPVCTNHAPPTTFKVWELVPLAARHTMTHVVVRRSHVYN
jgi:4'-phosphopantetheinyl transferase